MILIGIGANLPGPNGEAPLVMARAAVVALSGITGLRLGAVSRFWSSAPVPASLQPSYVNAVARLDGALDPTRLLARLQAIEAAAGRVRSVANAARPLDLDILDMDGILRDFPDPVLPHPRLAERAFVLRPLAEIAPLWRHPRTGATIGALLAAVAAQDAAPL